jgi:prepilin-type N-terminal cleavage/methylation domain-containing protein
MKLNIFNASCAQPSLRKRHRVHRRQPAQNQTNGFTLIEVLIAVFILGIVLSTVYAAYTATFRILKISEHENDLYNMGRMTLQRMTQDFNSVIPYNGKFEWTAKRTAFGNRDFPRIFFTSNVNLDLYNQANPAGISTVDYFVDEDLQREGFVLFRSETIRRDKVLDNLGELRKGAFPICARIHSVVYAFYDSSGKEYETWDSTENTEAQNNQAPAIIAIELNLINPDNENHPYKFMTKVYLPVNKVDRENMPSQ